VLFALGSPVSFAGLLVGFVLSILVNAYAQAAAARALGDRAATRRLGGVRRTIDPYGAVGGLLSGLGWGVVPELALRSRARMALALLAGPVAVAALGLLGVGAFVAVGGSRHALPFIALADAVHGLSGPTAQVFFLSLGIEALGIAVLALVPLPPLTGWRLLELLSTNSLGWQRARHYLVDYNLGVLALLVLLILPLGRNQPLLIGIADAAVDSLLKLLG
jgi:hypothetical protein